MAHRPGWIEVGKSDCSECLGTGVERHVHDLLSHWRTLSDLKLEGYRCRSCDGSGKRSVGYMDLRDASGR